MVGNSERNVSKAETATGRRCSGSKGRRKNVGRRRHGIHVGNMDGRTALKLGRAVSKLRVGQLRRQEVRSTKVQYNSCLWLARLVWRFVGYLWLFCYRVFTQRPVLGSVLGCLSMWVEVPDRDALRRKISTPTVNGDRYG